MAKQITTTVYTLAELKEMGDSKAIEAAREWVREGQCTDSYWYEYTLELWKDALAQIGFENADIQFSGFWSQGDGASFTADVDIEKLVAFFAAEIEPSETIAGNPEDFRPWLVKQINGKLTTDKYRRLGLVACWLSCHVERISHHYSHENTCRFEAQITQRAPAVEKLLEEFAGDAEELREEICGAIYKSLEADYEHEMSDEVVDETAEANEYTFTKSGKRCG